VHAYLTHVHQPTNPLSRMQSYHECKSLDPRHRERLSENIGGISVIGQYSNWNGPCPCVSYEVVSDIYMFGACWYSIIFCTAMLTDYRRTGCWVQSGLAISARNACIQRVSFAACISEMYSLWSSTGNDALFLWTPGHGPPSIGNIATGWMAVFLRGQSHHRTLEPSWLPPVIWSVLLLPITSEWFCVPLDT